MYPGIYEIDDHLFRPVVGKMVVFPKINPGNCS